MNITVGLKRRRENIEKAHVRGRARTKRGGKKCAEIRSAGEERNTKGKKIHARAYGKQRERM